MSRGGAPWRAFPPAGSGARLSRIGPSRPNIPRRVVLPGPEYMANRELRRIVGATIETSLPNPETEPMRVGLSSTCTLAAYLAPCAGDASTATHMSATSPASTAFSLALSSFI